MNFKVEQISIANRVIDRIEEDGIYWYPLKAFFVKILCKKEMTINYRDSSLIRYMKVFEYKPYKSNAIFKTWCMNEQGIKFVLRRLSIGYSKNEKLNILRKKNLNEACIYFGINRMQEIDSPYINIPPNLKDYDIWSLLCIENDYKLDTHTIWKKCGKCNYYYPNRPRYFSQTKTGALSPNCKQCAGNNFKCSNKVIQYIYDNDGIDLLFALHNNKNNERIIDELNKFINKGGYTKNDN